MRIDYFYTALIDVLSYRNRLERDISSGTFDFKEDLEKALSIFDSINAAKFNVNAISDTIILTCNSHVDFPEFLEILQDIFLAFLNRKLFIRGGVAYSKHFQSGRLTYSHAVARAYEIESKLSIYPRIVIDDNIIQMYKTGVNLPSIFGQNLFIEQNGVTFLNVLKETNWNQYFNLAATVYQQDKASLLRNENAFLKHQWFEAYLFNSSFSDKTKDRYIEAMKCL